MDFTQQNENTPVGASEGIYNPYMFQQPPPETASVISQTNPSKILEKIEHSLRGEIYDHENQKWIEREAAWLNKQGIGQVMIIAQSIINQNTIMSNLDDREIRNMIITLADELILLLRMRYQEFEVDKAKLTSIVNLVCRLAFCSLKRGWLGDEKKFLNTSLQSREIITQRPMNEGEKKSRIPSIMRFFK